MLRSVLPQESDRGWCRGAAQRIGDGGELLQRVAGKTCDLVESFLGSEEQDQRSG